MNKGFHQANQPYGYAIRTRTTDLRWKVNRNRVRFSHLFAMRSGCRAELVSMCNPYALYHPGEQGTNHLSTIAALGMLPGTQVPGLLRFMAWMQSNGCNPHK